MLQVILLFHSSPPFATDVQWPVRVPVVYKVIKVLNSLAVSQLFCFNVRAREYSIYPTVLLLK